MSDFGVPRVAVAACMVQHGLVRDGSRRPANGGRQHPARRGMLPRKHALARLPRTEGLSRRNRLTKNHETHPFMGRIFVCERFLHHGFFPCPAPSVRSSGQALPCVGAFGAAAIVPVACMEMRGSDEYRACALRATSTVRGSWMPPIFFGQVVAARQSF